MTDSGLRITMIAFFCAMLVAGCGSVQPEAKYPTGADRAATGGDIYKEAPSIFGSGGIGLFGNKKEAEGTNIGVNSYLWRAALDTISFMPIASADPFGGVVLTDWYVPAENPQERIKLNVLILDRQLSANGIRVSVFRQKKTRAGWKDAEASPDVARKLEDSILARARQMRIAEQGGE